jgi:TRAP-type uncharacterized transport system substrate-binding protein
MKTLKFLIIFLLLLLIPVAYVYIDKSKQKKEIVIATGGVNGAYYGYATKYKKELEKEGVKVKIQTTQGSLETQELLLNHKVDFGFVQGGTEIEGKGLQALANIAYEPIWVFYTDKNITSIAQLKGKKIAVGGKKSGIYPVAMRLLTVNNIDENNSKLFYLPSGEASKKLESGEIDAMFYVAGPSAKLVQKLLKNPNIFLLNFLKADGYRQYFLKNNRDFQILHLKQGGFDILNNIPKTSYDLLSKKTIVATVDASEEMSRLLLKIIDKIHQNPGIFHTEHTFPNTSMFKIDQHPASTRYFKEKEHFYEEHFSFFIAQTLDKMHNFALLWLLPLLTLFAFFVEVVVPTIDWIARRKIIVWYDKINEIDTGIEFLTHDEAIAKRDILEDMIHKVREVDDIPPTHMEEFYTLQNQMSNIMDELKRQIKSTKQ